LLPKTPKPHKSNSNINLNMKRCGKLLGIHEHELEDLSEVTCRLSKAFIKPLE